MTEAIHQTSDGYRRLAAASAVAGLFAYALTVTITPAAINQISPICHNSDALLGWLFRVSMGGFFVCVLLGGRLADKYGKLPVLAVGCVMMAAGSFAFSRVTTYPMAVAAMTLMGAGGGFAEGIAMGVIADVVSADRRTSMMNCAQIFFAMGAVAGPLMVTGLLAAHADWRWAYVATSVLCVAAGVTTFAGVAKREERIVGHVHSSEWRGFLKDRVVLMLSLAILLYVGAETGQASWVAKYFRQDLGAAGPMAAATVALFWVGIGLGRFVATWTSRRLSDYAIMVPGLGLALVCQIALLVVHTPILGLIAVPLLGFGLAPTWPTIVSLASSVHPKQSGMVLGIVVAAGALGAVICPPAIGQVAELIGLRHALWICVAVLALTLAVLTILWRWHQAR